MTTAKVDPNDYPPGWNRERVEAVIRYYDAQTEEEELAELESAEEVEDETWLKIPRALVPEVQALIEAHGKRKAS